MNLTIDQEFEAFIPPLDAMDYARLKANILADGCREPISVWNGTILDGHNRYRICTENNIPFATVEVSSVRTRAEAFIWMYENQLGRRNLEPFARAEMALKVKPYIEERAKERSRQNLKQNAGNAQNFTESQKISTNTEVLNSAPREKGLKTVEILAKKAQVGKDTIQRVEKILEKAEPEIIEKARSGEISINQAYQTVKPAKKPEAEPQTQAEKDRAFIEEAMSDGPTLEASYELRRARGLMTCFCEGFATGLTLYQSIPTASVVVCFNSSNLVDVAKTRKTAGMAVICADNDHETTHNPGITKGKEAAEILKCGLAYPEGICGTDWDDARQEWGERAYTRIRAEVTRNLKMVT